MRRTNDHPQPCFKCRETVSPGGGFVYPGKDGNYNWRCYHLACDSRNGTATPPPRKKQGDGILTF